MGTLRAEVGSRGKRRPAVGARPRQGCRALLTELRAGAILVLAPGTLHAGPPSQLGQELSERWGRAWPGVLRGSRRRESTGSRRAQTLQGRLPYLGPLR